MSAATVVAGTLNCEILLDGYGFYVRCFARNCPYVSGYTHAKHVARQWADAHDHGADEPAKFAVKATVHDWTWTYSGITAGEAQDIADQLAAHSGEPWVVEPAG